MSDNTNRVQTRVPAYQKWVIEKLVDVMGRNEADVLARIIGQWIDAKEQWLLQHGLDIESFKGVQQRPWGEIRNIRKNKNSNSEDTNPETETRR